MPDSKVSTTGIARLRRFVDEKEYLKARDSFERVIDPDAGAFRVGDSEYFDEKNRIRHEIYWKTPVKEVIELPGEVDFHVEGEPERVHTKDTLTEWIEKKLVDTLERIEKDFSVEERPKTLFVMWSEQDWSGSIRALLRVIRRQLEKEEDEECRTAMNAVIERLDWKLIGTLPDEIAVRILSSGRGNPDIERATTRAEDRELIRRAQQLIDKDPDSYRPTRRTATISEQLKDIIAREFHMSISTAGRRLKQAVNNGLLTCPW